MLLTLHLIGYKKFEKKFDIMRKIIETSSIDKEKQQQFLEVIEERMSRLKFPAHWIF